jgi:hypothetical protein
VKSHSGGVFLRRLKSTTGEKPGNAARGGLKFGRHTKLRGHQESTLAYSGPERDLSRPLTHWMAVAAVAMPTMHPSEMSAERTICDASMTVLPGVFCGRGCAPLT